MPSCARLWNFVILGLIFLAAPLCAAEVWSGPAFSANPAALREAAGLIKADKNTEATVLLNDCAFSFDETGKEVTTRHLIYRIENQQGVERWAEVSGEWKAWYQNKPEIKARVITPDGVEHWLDSRTLSDVPVHQNAPDMYSDARRFGGPLPAIAPGAIAETEVIIRDTSPLLGLGLVMRMSLGWSIPVNKTHLVVTHPASVPLHCQVRLLPDATVKKSNQKGQETITIEHGPIRAYTERLADVPADAVWHPEFELSTGTSWHQFASEYARLTEDKLRTSDVQPLLAEIKVKAKSRNEVIRQLVAILHQNVRYTGVEFGETSWIPQFPSETLKRKYGDCKDKAALLATMLRGAGIPASLALLNAGGGQDISPDMPGVGGFNHMIVYVPAAGTDSELWIDATAQYSQVGTLPWADHGRWALVVDSKTDALKRIPEITSAQNVLRQTREFTLAEYGMALIVETDTEVGPAEAELRHIFSSDSKQVREYAEAYVKRTYLAESLTSLERSDLSDLDKPAFIKFITRGRRGNTELAHAIVAIRLEGLYDPLPRYFVKKEADDSANKEDANEPPRTVDWKLTPFITEWHYKVTAPPGFKLRGLPSDQDEKVGSLSFTGKFSVNPEGTVVEAVFRVENTRTRITVRQAQDLRDAVVKARNADPIYITFDSIGYALISAGKIKEGLAACRQLAAQHPREALHKVQMAQALLSAGLGEQARAVAREATTLEPGSSLAFSTLGLALKCDLIGRQFKKGMDLEGAITAYRKAIALNPKDEEARANLAILLEFDADGTRYSEHAPLHDAVREYRELKKLDEEYGRRYDENVLYDLWYSHDDQGVLDYAATVPSAGVGKGLTLAVIALQKGADSALKKSLEITTDDQDRGKALVTAGMVLIRIRKYAEGSALLAVGARGQTEERQLMRKADLFSKTKPYEELKFDPADPRSVVQQLIAGTASGRLTAEERQSLIYSDPDFIDIPREEKAYQQAMSMLSLQAGSIGFPRLALADLAISNMHCTAEGDDSTGYKIMIESPGAPPQDAYVIRDGGHYKVAAYSLLGPANPEDLAPLALRALAQNNLAAARKWLDWARDKVPMSGGDDPLAGQPFPYFWMKGQEGDAAAIRTAAMVLLPSEDLKGPNYAALDQVRKTARMDLDRSNQLTVALAYADAAQKRWAEMLPLAQGLVKSLPNSVRAFELAASAYAGLKQFDAWDKLVNAHLQDHPDELAYIRSAAGLAAYRGDLAKSRQILKAVIDKGQATELELNDYAWSALVAPGPIDQASIDAAQRAVDLTKGASFPFLHTLACLQAQAGKPGEARELLLRAMDAGHLEVPDGEVWFGFALIAEQYGVLDAAEKMYERVEKPADELPDSAYVIAQKRIAEFRKNANSPDKTGGK
jgi:tetratricopeptide (TPR) repeat protein